MIGGHSRVVDVVQFLPESDASLGQPVGHLGHHHGRTDPILVQNSRTTHEACRTRKNQTVRIYLHVDATIIRSFRKSYFHVS